MIRNGLSTKEIAQLRCISPATVRRHRENIRRKIGLKNRKANLATYLQASIAGESAPAVDTTAQPADLPAEEPFSFHGLDTGDLSVPVTKARL